nr:uncharacterized protein LOC109159815 [Ipomoea batatas]
MSTASGVTSQPVISSWSKLWKLPVPPKVKSFLWRCVRGIVPVKENLKSKHVWIGGGCAFCDAPYETEEHIFFVCPFASQLWSKNNVLNGRTMVQFMDSTLGTSSSEDAVHMAAVLWSLWNARNDRIWRNGTWSLAGLRRQVESYCAAWKHVLEPSSVFCDNNADCIWKPPPANKVKCNVDAAVFHDGVGFGAVLRDSNGLFVAAIAGMPILAQSGLPNESKKF